MREHLESGSIVLPQPRVLEVIEDSDVVGSPVITDEFSFCAA